MTQHLVKEFHDACKINTPNAPTISTEERRVLRIKLIAEELMELCEASGVNLYIDTGSESMKVAPSLKVPDLVEMGDALVDIQYLVHGSYLEFGLPGAVLFNEVHSSNMSKMDTNGQAIFREDGKVMKGPAYFKPQLESIIQYYIDKSNGV